MKRRCCSCQTEAAGNCERCLCTPCCRKHAAGVCPNHRPEGSSKRGIRGGASRQQRYIQTVCCDITVVVKAILKSREESGQPAIWKRKHAIAYWLLNAGRLMDHGHMMHLVLQDDPVLHLISVGQANAALRETSKINRPFNREKFGEVMGAARKLFVEDGDRWSLRLQESAPAASSGASPEIIAPCPAAIPEEDESTLSAILSEVDYDADDVPFVPSAPAAPAGPRRDFPPLMANDLYCSKKTPAAPEIIQRCRSLLNLEQFVFSTEDLLKMPLKRHAEHLRFIERVGSFLWNTFSNKPAPHIRGWANQSKRQAVNVYGSKHDELKKGWCKSLTNDSTSDLVGWLAPATEALSTLVTWLRLRPTLFDAVGSMTCVDQAHFEGHKIQSGTESLRADGCGYWWRLELDTTPLVERMIGWHATSFYCRQRVVLEGGPREGFAENDEKGKKVKGVFYMRGPQAHCCDNYLHHVMLDDDGWLFAPLLQMAVDEVGIRNRSDGALGGHFETVGRQEVRRPSVRGVTRVQAAAP